MNAFDNQAMQALSEAGAMCGACGDEPGDRNCPDCERCYEWYVAALRAAGWSPRAEVLREAADELDTEFAKVEEASFSDREVEEARGLAAAAARLRRNADEAGPKCLTCKGDGGDPDDEGDWDSAAGMHNPGTRAPCPNCHGTGLKPA